MFKCQFWALECPLEVMLRKPSPEQALPQSFKMSVHYVLNF